MTREKKMWKTVEEEHGELSRREAMIALTAMEWADETMIERAVEWLCMNMTSFEYFGINGNISKPNFIRRFKEAMKGEQL